MNRVKHEKWNLMQIKLCTGNGEEWNDTYMHLQNRIWEKEEKDLGMVIQDDWSPEKHIKNIVGDTYNMLKNIKNAFHFKIWWKK